MTQAEKNEVNAILLESFRYFVYQHYIPESYADKMRYYIRDKIYLRIADTSTYTGAFERVPDNIGEVGRTELSDI